MSNIARKQHLFATLTPLWHTASQTNMLKPKSAAEPKINNKYIRHHYKMAKTANVLCRVQQTNEIITARQQHECPVLLHTDTFPTNIQADRWALCVSTTAMNTISNAHQYIQQCIGPSVDADIRGPLLSNAIQYTLLITKVWVTTAWKSHGEG